MKTTWTSAIFLAASCTLLGCTFDDTQTEADENVAETEGALVISNALNGNALNANALNGNALNGNALNGNALNGNSLAPSVLASIQDPTATGDLARELLKYMVSCGFDAGDSFSFSWVDSDGVTHNETYGGNLGLTKDWPTKPLSTSEQEWLTACLVSRVNWYGVSVMLSSRAQHTNLHVTDVAEGQEYTNFEGAFWGNIFSATPTAYACNDGANIMHSRAALRDCAAGHLNADGSTSNCGIITVVGDCDSHCSKPDKSDGYFPSCGLTLNGNDKTHRVISTFIP